MSQLPSMRRLPILFLSLAAAATPGVADEIDLNVGSDALRIGYVRGLGETHLELDFSYLTDDDDDSDTDLGGVGLHVVDVALGSGNWRVGLGGRVYHVDVGADDATAVALGGHARYRWPGSAATEVSGSLHWAPDASTFDRAEEFIEADVRLAYNVIERGAIYVGARRIHVDFEEVSSRDIDAIHIGFRISY